MSAYPERATSDPNEESGGLLQLQLRGEMIVSRLERANTSMTRMKGLLGRSELGADEGLWITPCNSIHMVGMRFPIDAVFIDESLQVVRVHEGVQPWRMARGGKHAASVLELPAGKAAFYHLRPGDRLTIAPRTG